MNKRGQFSTEYLIVGTFAFLILTSGVFFLYTETRKQHEEFDEAQLKKFGSTIVASAQRLAYTDSPSKLTPLAVHSSFLMRRCFS